LKVGENWQLDSLPPNGSCGLLLRVSREKAQEAQKKANPSYEAADGIILLFPNIRPFVPILRAFASFALFRG